MRLELLTREKFQPATTINVLAAAWTQFMVRDWFSHGKKNPKENPWLIQLRDDDPWPEHPMKIFLVPADSTRPPSSSNLPPTYINTETHWWDASQIYGSSKEQEALRRSGRNGKLIIGSNGLLQLPSDPNLNPALVPGWWLGMEMMITLFTLEHNAICDRLCAEYPNWSDDDSFERAAHQCSPDSKDSRHRMDAGHYQPSHITVCSTSQLMGYRNGTPPTAVRSPKCQRGHQRHSGFRDESLRCPLLLDAQYI